jgi:hypothetical protein
MNGHDDALGDQARAVTHIGPLAGAQPTGGGRVPAFGSGQEDEIPLDFGPVGEEDRRLRHDPGPQALCNTDLRVQALGPARAIGADERMVTAAGSLHNANFFIRHRG